MSVLSRDALEGSPLSDLHLIAAEVGLDGYRRLRKADLVDAILEAHDAQGGAGALLSFGGAEIVVSLKDAEDKVESVRVYTVPGSSSDCLLWPTGRGNLLRSGLVP